MIGAGGSLSIPSYFMASEDSMLLPLGLAQSPEPSASFSTLRPSPALCVFIMEIRNWKGKLADGMQLALGLLFLGLMSDYCCLTLSYSQHCDKLKFPHVQGENKPRLFSQPIFVCT